jgi:ketosteroid isomerase-like protein
VSDARFCVRFVYDITNKPSGRRMTMDELAVYLVKDGKIVREEFFYGA